MSAKEHRPRPSTSPPPDSAVVTRRTPEPLASLLTQELALEIAETLLAGHAEIGEGVVLVDPPRYLYANEAFCAMTGYSLAELRALPSFSDIAIPEEREALAGRLEARLRGSLVPTRYETRILRKDGQPAVLDIAVRVIHTQAGIRTVSLVRDATERHRTLARLIEAERLANLGRRVAEVAHDVTNPLFNVKTSLAVLARHVEGLTARLGAAGPEAMADVQAALDTAVDATRRIQHLVSELRLETRQDRESVTSLDLGGVIERATSAIPAELRQRGRLVTRIDDVPMVLANEPRLVRVFVNLLTNAYQALDEARPDNVVTVTARADGAHRVAVTVEDTGAGIPREHLERIFDPFFTTKPIGVGTGLGLAICLEILRAFGGDIAVESTPDVGTVIRIGLPTGVPLRLAARGRDARREREMT